MNGSSSLSILEMDKLDVIPYDGGAGSPGEIEPLNIDPGFIMPSTTVEVTPGNWYPDDPGYWG